MFVRSIKASLSNILLRTFATLGDTYIIFYAIGPDLSPFLAPGFKLRFSTVGLCVWVTQHGGRARCDTLLFAAFMTFHIPVTGKILCGVFGPTTCLINSMFLTSSFMSDVIFRICVARVHNRCTNGEGKYILQHHVVSVACNGKFACIFFVYAYTYLLHIVSAVFVIEKIVPYIYTYHFLLRADPKLKWI